MSNLQTRSDIQTILTGMESRAEQYQKAIDMQNGNIPFEENFVWPKSTNDHKQDSCAIWEWTGARRELLDSASAIRKSIADGSL